MKYYCPYCGSDDVEALEPSYESENIDDEKEWMQVFWHQMCHKPHYRFSEAGETVRWTYQVDEPVPIPEGPR